MFYPNKKDFLEKTKIGDFVPLYKEMLSDCETPVSAFLKFRDRYKYAYLLESVEGNAAIGRYSFLGLGASTIFRAKGNDVEIIQKDNVVKYKADSPVEELEKYIKKFNIVLNKNLPRFFGGAVGYFSYDIIRYFEKIPYLQKDNDIEGVYDLFFVFAENIIVFDRVNNSIKIVVNVNVESDKSRCYDAGIKNIGEIEAVLRGEMVDSLVKQNNKELKFVSNVTKEEYMAMVDKSKEYIRAGDIFQVVLSQRWELDAELNLFNVYRCLRQINPSPYMFYLKLDATALIGSSPEVMVKGDSDEVMVRPIAGTRPRSENIDEDLFNERDLLADEKECAEHVMLVDLGRNDLGRISKPGTVRVDDFKVIERYSHVMHIVSQVRGKLCENKGLTDVFAATFPAGTVSGAPKIRAMEIIEELEKNHRGAYAGSVAYISFDGAFDSCITLRTIFANKNKLYFQAGAGLVADSVPENEYNETVNKIKVLFTAVARSCGKENIELVDDNNGVILIK